MGLPLRLVSFIVLYVVAERIYGLPFSKALRSKKTVLLQCSQLCPQNNRCRTNGTVVNCRCLDGYFNGIRCWLNPCSSDPCKNNATCVEQDHSYKCLCKKPFIGTNCDVRDSCLVTPCKNGICRTYSNNKHISCDCFAGYTGSACETYIDECANTACIGKDCIDGTNQYNCNCERCEHGLCLYKNRQPYCWCFPGYYGPNCSKNRDECLSRPCIHGSCSDASDGFECTCHHGYTGRLCDQYIKKDCLTNPCLHGTCLEYAPNISQCICPTGYSGRYCQVSVDVCQNKCMEVCIMSTDTSNTKLCVEKCRALCLRYNDFIAKMVIYKLIQDFSTTPAQHPSMTAKIPPTTPAPKLSTTTKTLSTTPAPQLSVTTKLPSAMPTPQPSMARQFPTTSVLQQSMTTKLSLSTPAPQPSLSSSFQSSSKRTSDLLKITTTWDILHEKQHGQSFISTVTTAFPKETVNKVNAATLNPTVVSSTHITSSFPEHVENTKTKTPSALLQTTLSSSFDHVTTHISVKPMQQTGPNLPVLPDQCNTNCLNGKCINRTGLCECFGGFIGVYCDELCPCVHGDCQETISSFRCVCKPSATGVLCDQPLGNNDPCQFVVCAHGHCQNGTCVCKKNYMGVNCNHYQNETSDTNYWTFPKLLIGVFVLLAVAVALVVLVVAVVCRSRRGSISFTNCKPQEKYPRLINSRDIFKEQRWEASYKALYETQSISDQSASSYGSYLSISSNHCHDNITEAFGVFQDFQVYHIQGIETGKSEA